MTDVKNLNVARADKSGDSRLQSVSDCLEGALQESRGGRWSKCLLVFYDEDGRKFHVDMRCSGVTALEARGLMLSWIREEILE